MGTGKERRTGADFLRRKASHTLGKYQKAAIAALRWFGREAVTMEMICMGNMTLYLCIMASGGTS